MFNSSFHSRSSIFCPLGNYLRNMDGAPASRFVSFVAVLLYSGIDGPWPILCKLFIYHWLFKSTEEELEHCSPSLLAHTHPVTQLHLTFFKHKHTQSHAHTQRRQEVSLYLYGPDWLHLMNPELRFWVNCLIVVSVALFSFSILRQQRQCSWKCWGKPALVEHLHSGRTSWHWGGKRKG